MKFSGFEIRQRFLDYFSSRDHLLIGSSSLVPNNDPTLLLINAGMAPLKLYFNGGATPPYKRLCDIQKCIRTNDIDNIGDRHHLTFFEMMGNWAINDYFKELAIELAFGLIKDAFGFDTSRLYVTFYGGDEKFPKVPPDEETKSIWEGLLPKKQIVQLGAATNFWGPAGDTGPCGPCTEIFIDRGENYSCGKPTCGPDCDCGRYLEIWNGGVFMQYYLHEDGNLTELPFKSVDAGAGLERFALILQGVDTIYETDLLSPIVESITSPTGLLKDLKSVRIMTDHMRCATFMISDGIYPSNTGREYVLRRILRRSLLHAKLTGVQLDTLKTAIAVVRDNFVQYYPGLENVTAVANKILAQEASAFTKILNRGLREFEKIASRSSDIISGIDAFHLLDTLGFPFEFTKEIAQTYNLLVDEEGFKCEFEKHRAISRGK